jgi:hypothetical protein
MVSRRVITGVVLLSALATAPVLAQDRQDRRSGRERRGERSEEHGSSHDGPRAVPRSREADRSNGVRQRQYDARRHDRYDTRRHDEGRREYRRPYYSSRGGYGSRPVIVHRVRPRIVTVVPYRPYVYRPSIGLGVYYGAGGSYPYGYTPRGYYDPIPGRVYGGVRITNAPHQAQVFADGYYVGIVDDFDGVFQHVNLEAGEHHIVIQAPGLEPIEFDVVVQPGRTITFRADLD